MNGSKKSRTKLPRAIRSELVGRLSAQRPEIEQAILGRIRRSSEPAGVEDPAYIAGLQSAVAASLSYGFEAIKNGGNWIGPIPSETGAQARRAARDGVRLDTIMRRYAAGNKALEEFILIEADDIPTRVLGQILTGLGPLLDRLMDSATAEYLDELDHARRTPVQREAERIVDLLESNSLTSPVDLGYDFDLWHVGMILRGRNGEAAARAVADRSTGRSLRIIRDSETVWAWLASGHQPDRKKLEQSIVESAPAGLSLALGEARTGLTGWRLTHREAQIALQVMLKKSQKLTRGREAVLRAGVLRDDTLVRSLLDGYLVPLEDDGKSDRVLIETLRAYFSTGGNAAAAACQMGVQRHTVQRRIRTVEERLGQFLHTCYAELYVALQIDELTDFADDHAHRPQR
jgi:PucR C-terminal helix-turn-helix domain/GGDEF-like domain